VGRILDALKELELDETTYVFFLSDNGPWHAWGEFGGDAAPLRGAKTSTWEGGFRVPFIVRAPGKVPQNVVCNEIASSLDILPTIAKLADAKIPKDRKIDGHDISSLLENKKGAKSPTKAFYYYQRTILRAVRSGDWKLHLPHAKDPVWGHYLAKEDNIDIELPMLFNLEKDVSEQHDLSIQNPKIVARLLKLAAKAQQDLGDYDRIGKGQRFFDPDPRRPDLIDLTTNN
jgi:arylsulfatase A-like enzyme